MGRREACVLTEGCGAEAIRALVQSLWPHRFIDALPDHAPLGDGGYGLDSVEIAELLLECEERFGVELTPDLFEGGPLTIVHLTRYFDRS